MLDRNRAKRGKGEWEFAATGDGDATMLLKITRKQELFFDGLDEDGMYQMIPVGESRRDFEIITQKEPVTLSLEPPGSAQFEGGGYTLAVGAGTHRSFGVSGLSAGRTLLLARNSSGRQVSLPWVISVKTRVTKTYSVCVVHDMWRPSPWLPPRNPSVPNQPPPDTIIRPIMNAVETTFRVQASVLLHRKGGTFEVPIHDRDLGDPLLLHVTPPGEVQNNWNYIVFHKTPLEARQSDITIYFTWDVKDDPSDTVTLAETLLSFSFVPYQPDPRRSGLTVAHEVGHALGLNDWDHHLLMHHHSEPRPSRLKYWEIDTVNPSGT